MARLSCILIGMGVSSSRVVRQSLLKRYTRLLSQTSPHFPIHFLKIYRCPFHNYTASTCGLVSFPRKRESRRRGAWGLDACFRRHDVLLASDLRNGHLVLQGICGVDGVGGQGPDVFCHASGHRVRAFWALLRRKRLGTQTGRLNFQKQT